MPKGERDGTDERSFQDAMASLGVRPLGKPVPAPLAARSGAAGAPGAPGRGRFAGASPPPQVPTPRTLSPSERERDAALAERDASRAERDAAVAERDAAVAERDAARAERDAALSELAAARAERDEAARRRDEFDAERRKLQRHLQDAEEGWIRPRPADGGGEASQRPGSARLAGNAAPRIGDLLRARGCEDDREAAAALRALLEVCPAPSLAALAAADPGAAERLLEDRLVLLGPGVELADPEGVAVLRVPPARCEVTGGSDIQAAFVEFVRACRSRRLHVVTVVGGSPAYRKQLRALAAAVPDAPKLRLVSGSERRPGWRAEADLRGSDLVVVWGATELDHAVSEAYHSSGGRVLRVAHRGIARMLRLVAAGGGGPRGGQD
jgi:hypothetical protein